MYLLKKGLCVETNFRRKSEYEICDLRIKWSRTWKRPLQYTPTLNSMAVMRVLHLSNSKTADPPTPDRLPARVRWSNAQCLCITSLLATMDPKCLYGLDGSDSGFEMSFDSENEATFSLDDTMGSEGFASSVSLADEDLQVKPKKRRQRRTRERSPMQVR